MGCPHNFKQGFSLAEVLVVVGILAILAGAAGPVYRAIQTKNNLDIAAAGLVTAIRRAENLSTLGASDSIWGVYVQNSQVTVFQGASYAARTASFDEKINFPTGLTVSGNAEYVFSKFYGLPSAPATTTIANSFGLKNISVNAKGVVSF